MPGFSDLVIRWNTYQNVVNEDEVRSYFPLFWEDLVEDQQMQIASQDMSSMEIMDLLKKHTYYGPIIREILQKQPSPVIDEKDFDIFQYSPEEVNRNVWEFYTQTMNAEWEWMDLTDSVFTLSQSRKQTKKYFRTEGLSRYIMRCFVKILSTFHHQWKIPPFYWHFVSYKKQNHINTEFLDALFISNMNFFKLTNKSLPVILFSTLNPKYDKNNRVNGAHAVVDMFVPYYDQHKQMYYNQISIDTSALSRRHRNYVEQKTIAQQYIDASIKRSMQEAELDYPMKIHKHSCSYDFQNYGTCAIYSWFMTFKMLYSLDHPNFWSNINSWCRGLTIPYKTWELDEERQIKVSLAEKLEKDVKIVGWLLANLVKFIIFDPLTWKDIKNNLKNEEDESKRNEFIQDLQQKLITFDIKSQLKDQLFEACLSQLKHLLFRHDLPQQTFITKPHNLENSSSPAQPVQIREI